MSKITSGSRSEIFGKYCNVVLEKISWTDRVRNEEVLHTVKEERNILHKIKRRKAKWIGNILRMNCLPKHVTEGKTQKSLSSRSHMQCSMS
jgi:hypothetical protein